jgi:protein-S-isoprenylcysteine O-methyltransferase Ste14
MLRAIAVLGSAIFLVIAPGTLALLIPWSISHWRFESPFEFWFPLRIVGMLLIAAGLPVLLDSFGRFALQGLGTPAPILPPQRLVVSGLYRHVRNPIYDALVAIICGQGLLFGNATLLGYCAILWAFFHVWVVALEEPGLREKFGADYDRFCANVPRWIPRVRPWNAATYSGSPDPDSKLRHPRSSTTER